MKDKDGQFMSKSPHSTGHYWQRRLRHFLEARGQALVEYVLILVLVIMALAVVLSITGPAVGNVFSNTVANLLNLTTTPEDPMTEGEFWDLVTAVASYTPDDVNVITNTPQPDGDMDGDGKSNSIDNCPSIANTGQEDDDLDGVGNVCDIDSSQFIEDKDQDGFIDRACTLPYPSDPDLRQKCDNCINVKNSTQEDTDNDGEGNACEPPTPVPPPTDGPSPTPTDQVFPYPFTDTGNKNTFQTNFKTLLKGKWDASYWTLGVSGCQNTTYTMASGAQATEKVDALNFPIASHHWADYWDNPHAALTDVNFCAQYTQRAYIAAGTYTWRIKVDPQGYNSSSRGDRVSVAINGSNLYSDWDGQTDIGYKSNATNFTTEVTQSNQAAAVANGEFVEFTWTAPTTQDYDFDVRFVNVNWNRAALEVYLVEGGLVDEGTCQWENVTTDTDGGSNTITPRSGTTAFWSDSPNGEPYNDNSFCILRLRGGIDLTGSQYPYIEWYDQHALSDPPDTFWLAVRRTTDTQWYLQPIHNTNSSNFTWTKHEVNLTQFDGLYELTRTSAPTQNFVNSEIEVAFIVESNSSGTDAGWWISSFRIFEKAFTVFNFPFSDDFEGVNNWVDESGGTWAPHNPAYSGAKAWNDSPSALYQTNKDTSFQLDGLLDMRNTSTVIEPELVFMHSWDIASGTRLYVEISHNLGETWQPLRSSTTDTDDALITGPQVNLTWRQETIPLNITTSSGGDQNLIGERIMVRFRIQTGSTPDDGWLIDNVVFRNKPMVATVYPDWCDEFNNSNSLNDWSPEGSWNLAAASVGVAAFTSPTGFTDSPSGNYSHNTDSFLTFNHWIDLSASTNPILQFWHRWELAQSERISVEMYQENTGAWTQIWDFYYSDKPANYDGSVSGTWAEQTAWQRVYFPLKPLLDAGNTTQKIRLRWRLDARTDSAVDDGWYIDSTCVKEFDDPIRTVPFEDSFESTSSNNWYKADWNYWDLSSSSTFKARAGNNVMETLPGADYQRDLDAVLELRGILNLTTAGIDDPTLYYWENYGISSGDRVYVEVQEVSSSGSIIGNWLPVATIVSNKQNVAWNRRQVDLTPYKNKYLRLRFRLQGLDDSGQDRGIMIDGLKVVDRADEETTFINLPFVERGDTSASEWVREGDWSLVTDNRPLGTGSVLGPGLWTAKYYRTPGGQPSGFPAGTSGYELIGTEGVPVVSFYWGSSSAPVLVANDGRTNNFMISYTRRVVFTRETDIAIHVYSDDGHRLIIDNLARTPDGDKWGCWNCRTGQDPDPQTGTEYVHTFTAGSHDIEIQYWEGSGDAYLDTDFTLKSGGNTVSYDPFGGSSWNANYYKYCNEAQVTGTPWNVAPESVPAVDFKWATDEVSSIVQSNNTAAGPFPGQSAGGAAFTADSNEEINIPAEWAHTRAAGAAGDNWTDVTTFADSFDGTAIQTLPDNSTQTNNTTGSPLATYTVRFPSTGMWYLWVRATGPNGSANSFHVSFDTAAAQTNITTNNNSTFDWENTDNGGTRLRYNVTDASIDHTIKVWMREDGVVVDHLFLSKNSSATPPAEAPDMTTYSCNTGNHKEMWAARYERTISLSTATEVTFNLNSNNGHALWTSISGAAFTRVVDRFTNTGDQTSSYTYTFPAGVHKIRIEYANRSMSDGAFLSLGYDVQSLVLHSDSDRTLNMPNYYGASLILEREIDLTSVSSAGMTWWDRYDIGASDALVVEVSTIAGDDPTPSGSNTWTKVYERPGAHTSTSWQQRFVDLTAFTGSKIVIRFRVDGLNNSDQRNGWFIDDIEINN